MLSGKNKISLSIILIIVITLVIALYLYLPKILGDILYPLNYQEHILKYAKEYKVEPTLVAAIIYVESHYDPRAVSRVGARGLMQLMPSTAQGISKELGEAQMADLYDPKTNIRYGSYYISQKIKDFQGNVDAALAAYNGGPSVGNRFVISRETGIPRETQNFVKKVNSAKETYKKIYGDNLDKKETIEFKVKKQEGNWFDKIISIFKI